MLTMSSAMSGAIREFVLRSHQTSHFKQFATDHINYLLQLKNQGFYPKVIYDIGSCVLHWTQEAKQIWPNAEIILFEANPHCEFLYTGYRYHIGLLSNVNDKPMKFYVNLTESLGGASYYREIGHPNSAKLYPPEQYIQMMSCTLDTVVEKLKFPLPDLVKMDVQGSEKDIIEGGVNTISHAQELIVELPNVQYNENAPTLQETKTYIESLGW